MDIPPHRKMAFRLMVIYRWLALAAALLLTLFLPGERSLGSPLISAVIAVINTLIITLASRPLNLWLRRRPILLGLDLIFVGGLMAATGGWHSPYYLYALSPILAAAFFFQWRGALITATVLAALFGAGLWWQWHVLEIWPNWEITFTYVIGFYLIGALFSYPTALLRRLRQARDNLQARNDDLSRAHRELQIIHELTRTMQSASDPSDVEEQLLLALVGSLGYPRAVIALTDPNASSLSSWLSQSQANEPSTPLPHTACILLENDSGSLAEALRRRQPLTVTNGRPPSDSVTVNRQLALGQAYAVYPLILRQQSLAVLAIRLPEPGLTPSDERTLTSITAQAAVALGNVQLCIDRTRRLAVEGERNRIAREIHDTVSQSLFGIVYTLDSCIKLLPEQPDVVKTRLADLHPQAFDVMNRVRQSIYDLWEPEVTADYFHTELQRYTRQVCQANAPTLKIMLVEGFDTLDSDIRRAFLRVAQEGMANVAKHARASQAEVTVTLSDAEASLVVTDNGVGFDNARTSTDGRTQHHFGLLGMQERINVVGGNLTIKSRDEGGTTVTATVPLSQNGEG